MFCSACDHTFSLKLREWLLPWCSCSRLSPPFSLFSSWGFPDMRWRKILFHTEGQGSSMISFFTQYLSFGLPPGSQANQQPTSSAFTGPGKAFSMLKSHTDFIILHLPFLQKKAYKANLYHPAHGWCWRGRGWLQAFPKGRQWVSPAQQHMGPREQVAVNPSHQCFPFYSRSCWCNVTLSVTT